MEKKPSLPAKFKKYFWDIDFKDVSSKPFARFVLERVMNFGDLNALKWLLRDVPRENMIDTAKKSRALDAKTRNFWLKIYGNKT